MCFINYSADYWFRVCNWFDYLNLFSIEIKAGRWDGGILPLKISSQVTSILSKIYKFFFRDNQNSPMLLFANKVLMRRVNAKVSILVQKVLYRYKRKQFWNSKGKSHSTWCTLGYQVLQQNQFFRRATPLSSQKLCLESGTIFRFS